MSEESKSASDSGLRAEHGPVGRLVFWVGVVLSIVMVYFNTLATLPELWTSAIHFAGFGFLVCMLFPVFRTDSPTGQRRALAVDLAVGLGVVACVVYLIAMEDAFYDRGSNFIWSDWIFSLLCVAIGTDLVRRTTGWLIPGLIVLSLLYVIFLGKYIPGVFHFPGLSAETVLFRQYFDFDGMFGTIARISSTYVFMFILFGAFLVRSGAGDFIIKLAMCAAGKLTGGPGLVAVLGSALMGSISGSAVANTVSTGVITIPLMKRAGFPAKFAAGVEASASTGGQLMPPVMGAGAFIMSNYTGISYLQIIAVSTLPALMYFASIAIWVRIEAMKNNIRPSEFEDVETPKLWDVLKDGGHNLIPIGVLVVLLVQGFTPTYAAGISILSVILASWFSKAHRMGVWAVLEALALGARNMASVAVLLVTVGIIVNVVSTTGIGNTFSLMITSWAGGSLLITIILVALASLILGMGLPVTASYIVLATLSAPAIRDLIVQSQLIDALASGQVPEEAKAIFMLVAADKMDMLGQPMSTSDAAALLAAVPLDFLQTMREQMLSPELLTTALLSAHMVIYWLSQDSNVTPPVCLTAFAAAAIAETPPMATGLTAWKIAKGLYIVPLLIAFTPFLGGDLPTMLVIFVFGTLGIYAFAGVLDGYLEAPLNLFWRLVLVVAAVGLFWPNELMFQLLGTAVLVVVFVFNLRQRKHRDTDMGIATA